MDSIDFAKLSGSGNDFICIDGRDGRHDSLLAAPRRVGRFARLVCNRRMGVGGDGLIFAIRPEEEDFADFGARFYEADGSEVELCGNGTACFVHWAFAGGWSSSPEIRILTPAGVVRGRNGDGEYVRVCIPLPEQMQFGLEVPVDGRRWSCDYAVTGVPHLVTFVEDLDRLDMARWGPALRWHERFAPRGVNANFVQVLGAGELALRTWEFGVEGETLACGTGSATAAVLAAVRHRWPREHLQGDKPVRVRVRSGDVLQVFFTVEQDGHVSDVCLETIVRFSYSGRLHAEFIRQALGGDS